MKTQNRIHSKPRRIVIILVGMFLLLVLTAVRAKCQHQSKFFFNECSLSVNRTMLHDSNTENRNGFGLGIYRSVWDSTAVKLFVGVEFNNTEQFRKEIPGNHLHFSRDVTTTHHNVSIPVSARLFPFNKIKLFFEAGSFLDLIVSKRTKGTSYVWRASQTNPPGYMHVSYSEGKYSYSGTDFGFTGGLGFTFPLGKCSLIMKADYKQGLKSHLQDNPYLANRYIRLMAGLKL